MFNILVTCNQPELASVLKIVKNILNFVQILGPILCIISLVVYIIRLINNPEDKKEKGKLKNIIIALLLVFFIPLIVNAAMVLCDDSFSFAACWNYVEQYEDEGDSSYIENTEQERYPVVIDSDKYRSEEKKDSDNDN